MKSQYFEKRVVLSGFSEMNLKYFGQPSFTATSCNVSVPKEIMQCIFSCYRMRSDYVQI